MANYIKLDWDVFRDPKVRKFRKAMGKGGTEDLVKLFILMSKNKGRADLNDEGVVLDFMDELGVGRPKLDRILATAAECGVIDGAMLGMGVVTSNRAQRDADARRSRQESAKAASDAAAAKRKAGT